MVDPGSVGVAASSASSAASTTLGICVYSLFIVATIN